MANMKCNDARRGVNNVANVDCDLSVPDNRQLRKKDFASHYQPTKASSGK